MTKDELQNFRQGVDTLKEAIRNLVREIQQDEVDKVGKRIDSVNSKVSKLQNDLKGQKSEGTRIRSYVDSTIKDTSEKHRERFIRAEAGLRELVAGLKGNLDGLNASIRSQEELIKRMDTRMGVLEQRFFDSKKENTSFRDNMVRDFDRLRSELSSIDMSAFEAEVRNDLQRTAANIRKEISDEHKGFDSIVSRMTAIEQSFHELERMKNFMETVDIRGLRRDMEVVKTRQKWVEEGLEHLNIVPLHDKLTEIENKVKNLRSVEPTIIE